MLGVYNLNMQKYCIGAVLYMFWCGNETMLLKEKEKSRIRALQIDNLKAFISVRRINRMSNQWVRELCRVMKGVDERTNETSLVVQSY